MELTGGGEVTSQTCAETSDDDDAAVMLGSCNKEEG